MGELPIHFYCFFFRRWGHREGLLALSPHHIKKIHLRLISTICFQELLTKHKMLSAEFLEQNYDKVFSNYEHLLNSENYVTRRQSLKLLGELLLDRHNFNVSI